MRNFLLLFLSLIIGCETQSEVKGCTGGWVEFTCKYPKTDERYKSIYVADPRHSLKQISKNDVWENHERLSMYHDTRNKTVRVIIKRLQHQDSGEYQCEFYHESKFPDTEERQVVVGENRCQEPFNQTAYRTAKTTITCDYRTNKDDSKFFCKDNGSVCDVILSTKSSLSSDGTFSLTETTSSFSMSISSVSPRHAGVYWCGLETNEGRYRAALKEIRLKVEDITVFRRSPTIGQNLSYWCEYPDGAPINKFICKGEDPSTCERLVSTTQRSTGRFSMKDDRKKRNITITVMDVRAEDTGTYWCGAQSTDSRSRNWFFHKLEIVGCETQSEVKGCTGGWVEFTCKYPKTDERYKSIYVADPRHSLKQISKNDVWENNGRLSTYHDTRNKTVRVIIKRLQHQDSGEYQCEFYHESKFPDTEERQVVVGENRCQEPFNQTAYRTAKTTITCDYRTNKDDSKFFCKDNGSVCDVILSTKSSLSSDGTFSLTETTSSFSMSISSVSPQHAGVYWCGLETNEGRYRAALKEIRLKVEDITVFRRSATIGQNLSYWCEYPDGAPIKKFICKGEDPSTCERLSTTQRSTGRFSMKDDKEKRNITITVMDVRAEDTGTYWCGAQSTDSRSRNRFFHKLEIVVTSPAASAGGLQTVITMIVCVSVLLAFVLVLIFIYRRHSRDKRTAAAAQCDKEEYIYEEIREPPLEPDSRHAMNTVYVTAKFPTNPSASLHYSTINCQNWSSEAGAEALITKPSYSACEYSAVTFRQSPVYSTVDQPPPTVHQSQEP